MFFFYFLVLFSCERVSSLDYCSIGFVIMHEVPWSQELLSRVGEITPKLGQRVIEKKKVLGFYGYILNVCR